MAVQIYGREIHWGFLNPGILKSLNHKWQKVEYAARKQHGPLAPVSWKQPFSAAQEGLCCGTNICYFRYCRQHSFRFLLFKTFFARQQLYGEKEKPAAHISSLCRCCLSQHSPFQSHLCPFSYLHRAMAEHYTHTHTPGCALTLHAITRVQITHSNSYSENQCYDIPTRTVQDQSTPISSKAFWAISAGLRATRNSEMRSQPLSPCKQKMREELFTDRMLRYKHRFNKKFHFSEF